MGSTVASPELKESHLFSVSSKFACSPSVTWESFHSRKTCSYANWHLWITDGGGERAHTPYDGLASSLRCALCCLGWTPDPFVTVTWISGCKWVTLLPHILRVRTDECRLCSSVMAGVNSCIVPLLPEASVWQVSRLWFRPSCAEEGIQWKSPWLQDASHLTHFVINTKKKENRPTWCLFKELYLPKGTSTVQKCKVVKISPDFTIKSREKK